MSTTRTTSPRRDGRTAATVPDEAIREEIASLWGEAARAGRCRPTYRHISERLARRGHKVGRGCKVGTARIEAVLVALEAAGELPDLPLTMQQQGAAAAARARSLGFWPGYHQQQQAEDRARLEEVRLERQRARRGRVKPPGPRDDTAALVREHRARERRIGLKEAI